MTDVYRTHLGQHRLNPETQMLNYGYDPALSQGAVKPPVFQTSTFMFNSAEEGRDFFDFTAGRKESPAGQTSGLVYSRFNHPNSQIVEDRMALYEETEACVLFSSGMASIATTLMAFVRPGDVIVHSQPLYGGTETLLAKTFADFGVGAVGFADGLSEASIAAALKQGHMGGRVAVIFVETPANPTNNLVDLTLIRALADRIGDDGAHRPLIVCDNTPPWPCLPASGRSRRRHIALFAYQIHRRSLGPHCRRCIGLA